MGEKTAQEPIKRHYRLTYRVRPPEECPVREVEGSVAQATVLFDGPNRRCELLVRREDGTLSLEHYAERISNSCPCSVVVDRGVIPHLEPGQKPGYLNISIYVTETNDSKSITEGFETVAEEAELIDYAEVGSETDVSVQVDLGSLTDKRRTALKRAITSSYYETPSKTTIEEMAAEAGISSSAFATRLRKAEQEVFGQIRRTL